MSLGFRVEEQRQWADENRSRVEEKTGAPVLAFSTFYRTGSWGSIGADQISGLAGTAIRLIGKRKAGGLPQSFILALTADRLHAFRDHRRVPCAARGGVAAGGVGRA